MNNILIGQSGGPTAAINSSLAGVFIGGKKINAKKIYGMVNGIEGLLSEKIIDLDKEFTIEIATLVFPEPVAIINKDFLEPEI